MKEILDAMREYGKKLDTMLPELQRLNAENARLRAALEAVEYGNFDRYGNAVCLWCGRGDAQDHASDCARQIALGINKATSG